MESQLPIDALLLRYGAPHYTDCFSTINPGKITLEEFVHAFYTAPLFRCERIILKLIGRGSTDDDVHRLLAGESEEFAAWRVESRTADQLLMCDFRSHTRSWFKVEQSESQSTLYFGSAVIAFDGKRPATGYRILLRLHRLYSRMLLRGAVRRLARIAS